MKLSLIVTLLIINTSILGMNKLVEVPAHKGSLARSASLLHDGSSFHVREERSITEVPNHRIDKNIRNMSTNKLNALIAHGYLTLNKNNDGDYSIKADGRVKGGGLISAWIAWGVTTIVGNGINIFVAKKVAKACGAKEIEATGSNTVSVSAEVIAPLALANCCTSYGVSGLGGAGASIIENSPTYIQDRAMETGVAVGVVSGATNIGWVEAAANAAFNLGMKIPKL